MIESKDFQNAIDAIDKINDQDNYEFFNYSDAFSTKFMNH